MPAARSARSAPCSARSGARTTPSACGGSARAGAHPSRLPDVPGAGRARDFGVFVAQTRSGRSPSEGTSSSAPSIDRRDGGHARSISTPARDGAGRPRGASGPTSSTPTSSCRRACAGALALAPPLVVTAHGQDVANVGRAGRGSARATGLTSSAAQRRSIAVSDWLRAPAGGRRCPMPGARWRWSTRASISSAFAPSPAAGGSAGVPVRRLAHRAEERPPARERLRAPRRGHAHLRRRRPAPRRGSRAAPESSSPEPSRTTEIPRRLAGGPGRLRPEPRGALRLRRCSKALAAGRPVVATRVGGPPEFVPDGGGVLVDPLDEGSILEGLRRAAALPCPNDSATAAAAAAHDVRRQAERIEAILEKAAGATPSRSKF